MDLTSSSETFAIGVESALARSALQNGLGCPFKASDAASALSTPTPLGQDPSPRLSFVVSSVAMESHRSVPYSLSDAPLNPVASVSDGEVRS